MKIRINFPASKSEKRWKHTYEPTKWVVSNLQDSIRNSSICKTGTPAKKPSFRTSSKEVLKIV